MNKVTWIYNGVLIFVCTWCTLAQAQVMGGNGDGFDVDLFLGTLNGEVVNILFRGGGNTGYGNSGIRGQFHSENTGAKFIGGQGDGFGSEVFLGTLDADKLSCIFEGGIGQGFSVARASPLIDGDYPPPPADCVDAYTEALGNLLVNDQTSSIRYEAVDAIHSIQFIHSLSINVIYNAGQEIKLLEGFEVEMGATFQIRLEGCIIE